MGSRARGLIVIALGFFLAGAARAQEASPAAGTEERKDMAGTKVATFGAGCFWCVEAVFSELDGVIDVKSGFSGGGPGEVSYKEVCTGTTGHAEVARIEYDPAKVSFVDLLEVFFKTHDPTTKDRQGADEGPMYRSAVFYHDEEQKQLAEKTKKELDASGAWPDPIVTEIAPFDVFIEAEGYHQDYFRLNPEQSYCRFVIQPKMDKFRKVFKDKLRRDATAP